MAISNYGELKTAVASWLNRADLTAHIPDFIRLAEQRISYGSEDPWPTVPLRIPAMQTRETGSITSSSIAFPTRFLEPIRLAGSSGGVSWSMGYVTPERFSELEASSALPTKYTYLNNAIKTVGTGAASYTLDYYQAFASLSADLDTNWVLTNAPGIYLYAALIESAPFLVDTSALVGWLAALRSSIAAVNQSTKRQGGGSLAAQVVQ